MFGKITFRFLLFAVIMDILSFTGLDPDHIFLYMTNPVSWFVEIIPNIPYGIKMPILYGGNLVFWYFVGRYVNRFIDRRRGTGQV
ncbi:MAG TPA: hypothetical protein VJ824_11490 [Bacillota bacterium]|nr:hypothetical protein [Bacillota bacterium]